MKSTLVILDTLIVLLTYLLTYLLVRCSIVVIASAKETVFSSVSVCLIVNRISLKNCR